MRVPSIGVTLEERRFIREIVREGYVVAERMMARYQDPAPGMLMQIAHLGQSGWARLRGLVRVDARG
ncbi:hypothetical protein [Devosia aquimaris]|uniref:hypothetical protein n=1 Tax=Devosia aquimaris TaxID=2866214 RepID=UPI001CD12A0A|nr:hypothetical protein [Devosia sp. CJK-A8-3]